MTEPEEIPLKSKHDTCPVHADLVQALIDMNKKLNVLIALALLAAGATMGRDIFAALLSRLGG